MDNMENTMSSWIDLTNLVPIYRENDFTATRSLYSLVGATNKDFIANGSVLVAHSYAMASPWGVKGQGSGAQVTL